MQCRYRYQLEKAVVLFTAYAVSEQIHQQTGQGQKRR
jgi:hypothetical protein